MPNQPPSKLRRAAVEPSATHAQPHPAAATLETADGESWRGFDLVCLGESLTQSHIPKIFWHELANCLADTLQDQALLILAKSPTGWAIVAEDGIHDGLRDAILQGSPACPFLSDPAQSLDRLPQEALAHEQASIVYEFIEHYWGWRVGRLADGSELYLMMFGADVAAPSDLARDAAQLTEFVAENIASDKARRQLVSALSAETQGLRISPAAALRSKIEQWLGRHDVS